MSANSNSLTTSSLAEFTSNVIPKLESNGSNFISFKRHFQAAAQYRGAWGHFDGTDGKRPEVTDATKPEQAEAQATWDTRENLARTILNMKVDEALLTQVDHLTLISEKWNWITKFCTSATITKSVKLRTDFMAMRFDVKAKSLRDEFDRVIMEHAKLLSLGINITPADYATMILNFIEPLPALHSFVQITATNQEMAIKAIKQHLAATSTPSSSSDDLPIIDAQHIMEVALVQYESNPDMRKTKGKDKAVDSGVAAATTSTSIVSSEKPGQKQGGAKGNRGNPSKQKGVTCWTCGGRGHKADKCPTPKEDSSSKKKGKNKSKDSGKSPGGGSQANVASQLDEIAGAWTVYGIDQAEINRILEEANIAEAMALSDSSDSEPDSTESFFEYDVIEDFDTDLTELSEDDSDDGAIPPLIQLSDSDDEAEVEAVMPGENVQAENSFPILHLDGLPNEVQRSMLRPLNIHLDNGEPIIPMTTVQTRLVARGYVENELPPSLTHHEILVARTRYLETLGRNDDFSSSESGTSADDERSIAFAVIEAEASSSPNTHIEVYDSGATQHMSPYRDSFVSFTEIQPRTLQAANQKSFTAKGIGDVVISVPNGDKSTKMRLVNVLFAPDLAFTLISIGKIDDAGYLALFGGGQCRIYDKKREVIGVIPKVAGGLYRVGGPPKVEPSANVAEVDRIPLMEAHRRFAHSSPRAIKNAINSGHICGIELSDFIEVQCTACIEAKAARKPISKIREGERATQLGGEIHSDIWGPAQTPTAGNRYYYISFTDDFSHWTTVFILRTKNEAFDSYKEFEAWLNARGIKVLILRADRGGEYLDDDFIKHLDSHGTSRKLTVHDTPEDNGVSERLNRTLMEKVRAVIISSGLPRSLWGEALLHIVWLKNQSPTKALKGRTPYEIVYDIPPNLKDVPIWGQDVWVHDKKSGKVGVRAQKGRWVGYDLNSNGHRIYFKGVNNGFGRVAVERSVTFSETYSPSIPMPTVPDEPLLEGEIFPLRKPSAPSAADLPVPSPSKPDSAEKSDSEDSENEPTAPLAQNPNPPETRATRIRKPSQYVKDLQQGKGSTSHWPSEQGKTPAGLQVPKAAIAEDLSGFALVAGTNLTEGLIPQTVNDARKCTDWSHWYEAINYEIRALEKHGTWVIEPLPDGVNLIGSRWVFDIKRNAEGVIVRYRARLVAQGFSQVDGMDFWLTDLYAPVAKNASVRTVLAMAARKDWEIEQVDIKSAYLYGEFDKGEVLYMKLPPLPEGIDLVLPSGIVKDDLKRKGARFACRLKRPLYGLRQSGRRFYQKMLGVLQQTLRVQVCQVDQAVFFRLEGENTLIIVAHVDDLTLVTSNSVLMQEIKQALRSEFEIVELGPIHWLLGIKIRRDRPNRTISLSQSTYINTIVEKFFGSDLKPLALPMDPSIHFSKAQCPQTPQEVEIMKGKPYREAVGSLMYAATGTRPDIMYAVAILSKFLDNPGITHWNAVKRVFQYLQGTKDFELTYGVQTFDLLGYSDADGSIHEDRRAVSGYVFLIDGGAVSWSSKQQEIVALSTTEAEYVGYTHAAKEALWLQTFIGQIFGEFERPTDLNGDSQSAIALSRDQQYHARTKHIDIRFHFIRWVISEGKIKLVYCPTESMIADTLTKALPSPKVKHFASALGLAKA